MTRFFCTFLALTAAACATAGSGPTAASTTPVRFREPAAAAELPHRTVRGAEAQAVFEALRAALPPEDTFRIDQLSCVHVAFPGQESTQCQAGAVRIVDEEKAQKLASAIRGAGALADPNNKMPAVLVKNVQSSRDSLTFDDAAYAKLSRTPNVRLTGKEADEVMTAMAGAGVREDDGTLFVVCHRFDAGKDPQCGYILRSTPAPALDRSQSVALWNAFVHDPKITVLNASNFFFDGQALSFAATLDAASPPPTPPTFP